MEDWTKMTIKNAYKYNILLVDDYAAGAPDDQGNYRSQSGHAGHRRA